MKKKINLKIVTPERVILESEATQITLPTKGLGEITILPDHIPYLSILAPGLVEVKNGEEESVPMAISGGVLEFHENELTLLADTAERAEEIDLERAEEARKRAEKMMAEEKRNLSSEQYAAVVGQLEKQMARIRVVKKYRPQVMKKHT
ncbi:MAG TPA: ATP synthase F1 subunit epsilon [Candidatus Moranbacteria bacterium]|nr:ATP synthase F1 subunit epsilon [Candidatus Moranbacteria bacterium]